MISDLTSAAGLAGPSGTELTKAAGGKMGKEQFLQLLVAQMNNQDPLNPMQGEDFVAQLAQFSSVEQLIAMNDQMEAQNQFQSAMVQAMNGTSALGAIGRTVVAVGDQVHFGADGAASVRFALDNVSGPATVRVLDGSGNVIGTQDLGYVGAGPHTFALDAQTLGVEPGTYRYEVVVEGAPEGSVVTFSTGVVDGIRYSANGPVLTAGPMQIPFGQVVEIVQ